VVAVKEPIYLLFARLRQSNFDRLTTIVSRWLIAKATEICIKEMSFTIVLTTMNT
jgi:hypothetical protein